MNSSQTTTSPPALSAAQPPTFLRTRNKRNIIINERLLYWRVWLQLDKSQETQQRQKLCPDLPRGACRLQHARPAEFPIVLSPSATEEEAGGRGVGAQLQTQRELCLKTGPPALFQCHIVYSMCRCQSCRIELQVVLPARTRWGVQGP